MNEQEIQAFWQLHPCGDALVGGLHTDKRSDYELFFQSYDDFRYKQEKHILKCLDDINFKDKRVLEIGLGQGADSEQVMTRRKVVWVRFNC